MLYNSIFGKKEFNSFIKLNHLVKVSILTSFGIFIILFSATASEETPKKFTQNITTQSSEEISFEMVLIPGGTFVMGSPDDEPGRKEDEGPQHEVRIDPFYLCTTETILELFIAYYYETEISHEAILESENAPKDKLTKDEQVDAITGPTPIYGDITMGYNKKHPAFGMTWHNAVTFCQWLSIKTGRQYRLPTEAEWEYACRAGSKGAFSFGNDVNQLSEYAWYDDNADFENQEVATKKPNAWGLYDMMGNVCEWVHDFYNPTYYEISAKSNPAENPKGPETSDVHVARGGDYTCTAEKLRCAARVFEEKWWRSGDPQIPKSLWWLPQMDFIGIRVAASISKDNEGKN